ncbi:hypothetical protein AMATHDRAFT_73369 [Amanita thiersii Skay4041]|uniref:Uncharacterized protein n=1 Tax=Amanita thiersii Skay4041 TaxID=703135 RepID=A0A2A9NZM9_9AGAR|nr:hypothetical protein AMATHDRAFT_73369 [Amanita thiersii Skay4041]
MSAKLSPYSHPPSLRSALIKNVSDAIPQIDDLEQLQAELKIIRQYTLDTVRKAGEDQKIIDESLRRMREKEKGKAKQIDKIKRERDFTPTPDSDEPRSSSTLYNLSSKPRPSPQQANLIPPSSSRSSLDPRKPPLDDLKKKKKKRKREDEDSDLDSEFARPRKTTPPVILHPPAQKASKSTPTSSQLQTKPTTGPDWSVPLASSYQNFYIVRPPIPQPPIPGPSKPTDVVEDFSKLKAPSQIQVTSFYSSIEPWIRPIREEDIGFLEYTGDEIEPFIMPKLGRHYSEVWEDEDAGILPPIHPLQEAPAEKYSAPAPKWDPSTLMEPELLTEDKGHGPLTERVISALLPVPDEWKGVKAAEDAMEGRPGGSGAAAARKEKLNVSELENRIKDTMRYHGLLDGMPDFTEKVDDPIATALRHSQRELRTVLATNKARRTRLVAIARDRLAFQEYLELRDSIDKNITTMFGKLQKKDGPKIGRKKKKIVGAAAAAHAAAVAAQAQAQAQAGASEGLNNHIAVSGSNSNKMGSGSGTGPGGSEAPVPLPPCPAALGLGPDEENRLVVHEHLKHLVDTRRQWVETVGKLFEEKQRMNSGRIWGLPEESIYRGLEDDVRDALESIDKSVKEEEEKRQMSRINATAARLEGDICDLTTGKGKDRDDAMDVG